MERSEVKLISTLNETNRGQVKRAVANRTGGRQWDASNLADRGGCQERLFGNDICKRDSESFGGASVS